MYCIYIYTCTHAHKIRLDENTIANIDTNNYSLISY